MTVGLIVAGALFAGSQVSANLQDTKSNQNIAQNIQVEKEESSIYFKEALNEVSKNIDVGKYSVFDILDDYIAGRTFDSTKIKEYFGESVTEEDLRNWGKGVKSDHIEYKGNYEEVKHIVEAYLLGIDKTYEKNGVENKYASEDDFTKKIKVYQNESVKAIDEKIDVGEHSVFDHENYYIMGRTLDLSNFKKYFGENVTAEDLRDLCKGKISENIEHNQENYEEVKSFVEAFLLGYDKTVAEQELENEIIEIKNSVMKHYHNQEKENASNYIEDENTIVVSGKTSNNSHFLEDDGRSM